MFNWNDYNHIITTMMQKIIEIGFVVFIFTFLVDVSFVEPYVKVWKDFSLIAKLSGIGLLVCLFLIIVSWTYRKIKKK